jgi:hypothetical protein
LRDDVRKWNAVSTGNIKMIQRDFHSEKPFHGIISYFQVSYPGN